MRPEEIGPESSWLNQQDSNVERLKLDGEGFRKGCIRRCQITRNHGRHNRDQSIPVRTLNGKFRHRVSSRRRPSSKASNAAYVYNGVAVLRSHVREDSLDNVNWAIDVSQFLFTRSLISIQR